MNKEQHIISDQPAQCQYFHGEEISPRENGHVGVNERFPCRAALALWGWGNAMRSRPMINTWLPQPEKIQTHHQPVQTDVEPDNFALQPLLDRSTA